MKYTDAQLQEVLKDPRYSDIGALPSQNRGYPWKTLYIRPFGLAEFKLVSKAAMLKDMSHMIRAVDLVITQDAAELTIGDFYYVMMWLRIHSLPKTPLVVTWECTAQVLRHKETGQIIYNDENFQTPDDLTLYETVDCDRMNTESLHMVNLEIISLDDVPEDGTPDPFALPAGFDFPRAKHIQSIREALNDPETTLMVPAAQWVAGNTLVDKFKRLEQADGMELFATGQALVDRMDHGLRETTTLCCANCRVKVPFEVDVNPMSFFR